MSTGTVEEYEQTVLDILRSLPPERAGQLVDFALFLEGQYLADQLAADEGSTDVEADEDRWNRLLGSVGGQTQLESLAREAREAYRAGETSLLTFDEEGRIGPG